MTSTDDSQSEVRIAFVQDGARLHYAIPLSLQRAGLLERVFIDWYASPGSFESAVSRFSAFWDRSASQRMKARVLPQLDPRRIRRNPLLTLYTRLQRRRFKVNRDYYAWEARQKARWIRRVGLGRANTLMGFVRNIDPDLCAWAKSQGVRVIVDQMIAPATVELAEARLQQQRWPGWQEAEDLEHLEQTIPYERATWASADLITCASEYVKQGLLGEGIPESRIAVIPYPLDFGPPIDRTHRPPGHRFTVGFVGQVGLRKGAPYFLEVAKACAGQGIRFVMVGPIALAEHGQRLMREHVELIGPVPRPQVRDWLAEFDLYLFPSTCEGSATSVAEAFASGLPVVTSPNSGVVLSSCVPRRVTPYDDTQGMARAISETASDGVSIRPGESGVMLTCYATRLMGLLPRKM